MRLGETVRADLQAANDGPHPPSALRTIFTALFASHLQAVLIYRLAHWLHGKSAPLGSIVKYVNGVLNSCDISAAAKIGPGLRLYHPTGIVVGPKVVIGERCTIMQGVTLGTNGLGSPVVGNDVFLAPGARLFGSITIGDGAYIGANAVVTKDVPPYEMWVGVPAKFHRSLNTAARHHRLVSAPDDAIAEVGKTE